MNPSPSVRRRPFSPSVTLSPNATYYVPLSRSGVEVTVNEHCACREVASTALHETAVVPTLNELPDAGVQVVVTGDVPPLTVAGGYVTACPLPGTPCTVMLAGHEMVGAPGVGAGSFGLPQPPRSTASATATKYVRFCKSSMIPDGRATLRRCRDRCAVFRRGTGLRPPVRASRARR